MTSEAVMEAGAGGGVKRGHGFRTLAICMWNRCTCLPLMFFSTAR
jgi:hypothetical protein